MSDVPPGPQPPPNMAQPIERPPREPFPAARLLYSLLYAVIGWFVFWLVLILAALQFIVVAINGHVNLELRRLNAGMVQYLFELLAYIAFLRDEQPFPVGPFPKTA